MSLPDPHPGLVLRYSFLWSHEHDSGQEDGSKDRPCAVVLRVQKAETLIVTVAPITHTPPADPSLAVEIPLSTKQRLGLDGERSWIILSEVNRFVWPGPDLRPVPGSTPPRFAYGALPPRLFQGVQQKLRAILQTRLFRQISRSD